MPSRDAMPQDSADGDTAAIRARARELESEGRYQEALSLYSDLLDQVAPGAHHAAILSHVGELHLRLERTDDALDALSDAVEEFATRGLANNALAIAIRIAEVRPDAEAHFRAARLAAVRGYGRDAREFALAYADAEWPRDPDAVIERLRELTGLGPSDSRLRELLAERLSLLGRHAEAGPAPAETESVEPPEPTPAPEDETDAPAGDGLGIMPTSLAEPEDAQPPRDDSVERLAGLETTSVADPFETPGAAPAERADDDLGLVPTRPEGAEPGPPDATAPADARRTEESADPHHPRADALDRAEPEVEPGGAGEGEDAAGEGELPLLSWGARHAAEDEEEPEPPQPERDAEPDPPEVPRTAAPPAASEGVRLGDLVLGDDEVEALGTRFTMDAERLRGEDFEDLQEVLRTFRERVADGVDARDARTHYDLGLAFKEMGLLDQAIQQFQAAVRAGADLVATLEALGECFVEKGEPELARQVLRRATGLPDAADEELVGVHYWLGRAGEDLGDAGAARAHYERVVAFDTGFRDAGDRLRGLAGPRP